MIKLKSILNEGKKNAKDISAGDVFIKDAGYGKATYVAMGSLKQSRKYKNEYNIFATVLVPGKKGKSKFNEKGAETYVTFSPKYGKFSDVEYVGQWNKVSKNYMNEGKSSEVKYKGKTYYVSDSDFDKPVNKQLFLYTDKNLKDVAKVGGKTLMVKKKDIEYKLK